MAKAKVAVSASSQSVLATLIRGSEGLCWVLILCFCNQQLEACRKALGGSNGHLSKYFGTLGLEAGENAASSDVMREGKKTHEL